jgi:cytochrome c556
MTEPLQVGALGAASAPLDQLKVRAVAMAEELEECGPDGSLLIGLETPLDAAKVIRELLTALDVEVTRAVLHFTLKGYTAGENADSKAWRERAEAAETEVAKLRALSSAPSSAPQEGTTK